MFEIYIVFVSHVHLSHLGLAKDNGDHQLKIGKLLFKNDFEKCIKGFWPRKVIENY